ncbi:MAG: serine/threonine-protein phosphatase [Acidobacteria bacterium]|nr:serine/threonine-protein phosphatase [Acidobacteriota bacterium]
MATLHEKQLLIANPAAPKPQGCVELWAGNEQAHRYVKFAGLDADVLSLPSGSREGGDLYALFSCAGETAARIVLADCVGHGHDASSIAAHIHGLIHRYRDLPDNSRLLRTLNDEFTLLRREPDSPLRLSTLAVATFDRASGEFTFSYAAHPRILFWRARSRRWFMLDGSEGFPVGAFPGSDYSQQSIRVEPADIVLMFSDAATDVFSLDDEMLTAEGFLELAQTTLDRFPARFSLTDFVDALAEAIRKFHGSDELEDDLTLLTLRRSH